MPVASASHTSLPPGPPGQPLLGNLIDLQRDQLRFLRDSAQRYGDVVPLQFGPTRVVLFNHPNDIEDILAKKNRAFIKGRFYRLLAPLLGNGLFTSEGDFWLRQRRLAQPAFHRERIAGYARIMVDCTRDLADTYSDGQQTDLYTDLLGLTFRIITRALFDTDVARESSDVGDVLGVAMRQLNDEINGISLLIPPGVPTVGRLRLKQAVKRLDRIVYRIVDERRRAGDDRGDLLAMLLAVRDDDGSRMTDRQVRDEAMTIMLAGHETTAAALGWTFFLLAMHQDIQAQVFRQLDEVLHGRPPTLEDLPNLPLVDQVVRESLRLYPPAIEFGRESIQPVEIGGYALPVGTNVLVTPWVVHRDARWFDAPDEFRPQRWADGLAQRLARFAYFPFSGGPRLCIGQAFAMLETTLATATLIQRFRVELQPEARVEPLPTLSLRFKRGLPVRLLQR
jgi:cytochrome P450